MTATSDGFVDLLGSVEPRSIAASIAIDAHRRVAEAVVLTRNRLEEEGIGLNELQAIELVREASEAMDGFEAATLAVLEQAFGQITVRTDGEERPPTP